MTKTMNTIVLTISKVILIIALVGPVLDWLFANYPELAFFLVVVASVIRYIFWLSRKFQRVDEKFEPKFVEIDKKFIHVDYRLDKIETHLDQHQVAIETLDKKVTNLQDDVAKGNIRLAVVETKL